MIAECFALARTLSDLFAAEASAAFTNVNQPGSEIKQGSVVNIFLSISLSEHAAERCAAQLKLNILQESKSV